MFGRRITLFKLLGFAVRADASWLIIAALVLWTLAAGVFPRYYPGLPASDYFWMGIAGAILLFASIVAHELCHALAARRYGIPMKGITLFVFGGIAGLMIFAVFELFLGGVASALWWFLIGLFLKSVARSSYRQLRVSSALRGEPVSRFMHPHPDTVTGGMSIAELVNGHIYRYRRRMFPVLADSERLEGCVTSEQVKRVPREEWEARTVREILQPSTAENTIAPETDSMEALRLMQRTHNSGLMVAEQGRLVAMVSMTDLLDFLAAKLELEGGEPTELRAA